MSAPIEHARVLADDVLFPIAQDVDRANIVPQANLDALAEAGMFGIAGPRSLGFLDLGPGDARRVIATLAGGCGATFFVWAQHHGVVRNVRSSPNDDLRRDVLKPMCAGQVIAGVAFAHVRRVDKRAIVARRVGAGWQLDGRAPWATSWGIADWFCIAAETDDGQLVWALVSGETAVGVHATALDLPVFGATGTVALTFDGCVVPDQLIVTIEDAAEWRKVDRRRSAIGLPAVLGVADRSVRLLAESARGDDDQATNTANHLAAELRDLWITDDELTTAIAAGADSLAEANEHRAACLDIGRRATTALLAAVGGGGMSLAHPAQRLARESMFYVIQAQIADGRAATLRSVQKRGG